MSDSATTERPAEKKVRSHYLYMAVIAAAIAQSVPSTRFPAILPSSSRK